MPPDSSVPTRESTDETNRPDLATDEFPAPCLPAGDDDRVERGWRGHGWQGKSHRPTRGEAGAPAADRGGQRPPGSPPEARRAVPGEKRDRDRTDVPVLGGAGPADQARRAV